MTRFNIWLIEKTENETTHVKAIPTKDKKSFEATPNDILVVENEGFSRQYGERNQIRKNNNEAGSDSDEEESDEERVFFEGGFTDLDHKEVYLKLIFEPFRFSKSNIIKSLGVIFNKD